MSNTTTTTTAQRIIASHQQATFGQAQALEAEARDLATKTTAQSCHGRTWTFHDGSSITKTSAGYQAARISATLVSDRKDLARRVAAELGAKAAGVKLATDRRGEWFVLSAVNVDGTQRSHKLAASCTPEARLAAHAAGFIEAHRQAARGVQA